MKQTSDQLSQISECLQRGIKKQRIFEQNLREKEELYRNVFRTTPDAVLITRLDSGCYVDANEAFLSITGYTGDELTGKNITELNFWPSENDCIRFIETLRKKEHVPHFETELMFKETRSANATLSAQKVVLNGKQHMITFIRDITELKTARNALRSREEKYRMLFENIPIEIIIVNRNGEVTGYNFSKKRAKDLLPKIGDIMYIDYASQHANDMYKELMDCINYGTVKEFPEQEYFGSFLSLRIYPFKNGAIITKIDITDRKQAEKQIKNLTGQIITVQENERKRISRDLHDSVAQDLSSLRIACDELFQEKTELPGPARKRIRDISRILHESIIAIRDIAYELRPPSLDEFGLPVAIFHFCEDFIRRNHIDIDFFSAGLDGTRIPPEIEINLYRIVQEALNNIKKHSQANQASIRLVASYPDIILKIDDNGIGFDIERHSIRKNSKNMGLRSMEERVNLVGGKITIRSQPDQGTTLTIKVPITQSKETHPEIYPKQTAAGC